MILWLDFPAEHSMYWFAMALLSQKVQIILISYCAQKLARIGFFPISAAVISSRFCKESHMWENKFSVPRWCGNTHPYSLRLILFSFLLFWICQYSDPLHGHSLVITLAVCCFIPWQKLILAYIHLPVVMLKNRYYYSGSKQRLGSYPVSNYFQFQKHHGNEFTSHSCELSPGLKRRVALPSSLLFQLSHFNLSSFLALLLVSSHP